MKKIFVIAILVTGFAVSSYAQQKDSTTKEFKSKHRKEWNKKQARADLNLTADQQAQLKTMNQEFKTKAKSIKSNNSLSEQEKKNQLRKLSAERREKNKSILTREQQQKLSQHRKQRDNKKQMKEGRSKQIETQGRF